MILTERLSVKRYNQETSSSRIFPLQRPLRWSLLIMLWFLQILSVHAQSSGIEEFIFDYPIYRGERLEFYRRADFSNSDPACRPCLVPQNVNCPLICYQQVPSLTLVCSGEIRAISLGPFTRRFRERILSEVFKTDSISFMTTEGEESVPVKTIRSEAGDEADQYAIDFEGIDSFKSMLTRATPTEFSALNLKIGPQPYTIPLDVRIRSSMHDFLRQCPN